jgi:chromosome segregation ATPase
VRAEIGENEVKLQAELDESREKSNREREDLEKRLHDMEAHCHRITGERDEARERVREVEARASAPDARTKALEMELNLLKSRYAREVEAKKAAESASVESRARQQEMRVSLEREVAQVREVQKSLAEQTELATFRQEICDELQSRSREMQKEAEQKLRREKGKFEAVSRLDGILPKHMLLKALA